MSIVFKGLAVGLLLAMLNGCQTDVQAPSLEGVWISGCIGIFGGVDGENENGNPSNPYGKIQLAVTETQFYLEVSQYSDDQCRYDTVSTITFDAHYLAGEFRINQQNKRVRELDIVIVEWNDLSGDNHAGAVIKTVFAIEGDRLELGMMSLPKEGENRELSLHNELSLQRVH